MNIRIERTAVPKAKPDTNDLPFGVLFTDHMFLMNYDKGEAGTIPALSLRSLYLGARGNGSPLCPGDFRRAESLPHRRGQGAAVPAHGQHPPYERLGGAAVRPQDPRRCVYAGAAHPGELEQDWVPSAEGTSLYIRPFAIATDPHVGVHAAHHYLFSIITCPVGSYYKEGINPVRILIESQDIRAVRGGTGYTKCGGNYAASLRAGRRRRNWDSPRSSGWTASTRSTSKKWAA